MTGGCRLNGERELAWFSRDDPLPFLMMCIRLFLRVVKRVLRMRPATDIATPHALLREGFAPLGYIQNTKRPCERAGARGLPNSACMVHH